MARLIAWEKGAAASFDAVETGPAIYGRIPLSENPSKEFYDRISGAYDLLADSGEHRARERGLELLDVAAGESVLEIGFGTGHAIVELAAAVGPGGHVAGVDISSGMREQALKRVRKAGVDGRIELRCEATPPLPYEDGSFDAIFLSFTLELFPLEQIPEVLKEIRRVLKHEGRMGLVSMATVLPAERESALEKTYKWMHQHFPHIVDCQPIDVEVLVEEAGYELIRSERLSMFTLPVAIVVASR